MATQVQLGLLANESVNGTAIKNQEVASDDIATNAVVETKIAANAVTSAKLSDSAVTSAKLSDSAVTNAKLADNAVTSAKLSDSAVTSAKLQSSATNDNERAVGTNHLKDGCITPGKISSDLEFFPAGGIIMWYGSATYQQVVINNVTYPAIPNGWVLCDGNQGQPINGIKIPDLRNKFIVGASDNTGTGVVFDATNGGASGSYGINNTGGEVAHKLTIEEMPLHTHNLLTRDSTANDGTGSGYNQEFAGWDGGPDKGTVTTESKGSDKYHENRPPYYALAFIIKVTSKSLSVGNQTNISVQSSVPSGSVFHFAASSAPTGFLVCDGSVIPNGNGTVQGITADFSPLYAIVGTAYQKTGDATGVRRIPDLRGEFIRGWDNGRMVDSGRTFGSNQVDDFASHTHTCSPGTKSTATSEQNTTGFSGGASDRTRPNPSTQSAGGTETRPKNVALLPCIKY